MTASHAVFPRDGGNTAPVGVLGYQFSLEFMYQRFMEISSGNFEVGHNFVFVRFSL